MSIGKHKSGFGFPVIMKQQISSFELTYLINEFQAFCGGRIENIYHPDHKEFIFRLYSAQAGKTAIRMVFPSIIYQAKHLPDNPTQPSAFCTFLRKRLKGSRIKAIRQIEGERIVIIEIEGELRYDIIIECFGKGNLLVTQPDQQGNQIIQSALSYKVWTDRSITKGEVYKPPPKGVSARNITVEQLIESASKSSDSIVKWVARAVGMGGIYAQEICDTAQVHKDDMANAIQESHIHKIYDVIQQLHQQPPSPSVIKRAGKVIDITPIRLSIYSKDEHIPCNTYSEAWEQVYSQIVLENKGSSKTHAAQKKMERIQAIYDQQSQQVELLKKQIDNEIQCAEYIYNNYQYVSDILSAIKTAKADKIPSIPGVLSVDGANKKVIIDGTFKTA